MEGYNPIYYFFKKISTQISLKVASRYDSSTFEMWLGFCMPEWHNQQFKVAIVTLLKQVEKYRKRTVVTCST